MIFFKKKEKEKNLKVAPVNLQPINASPDVLAEDVRYAIQVAYNYIKLLPGGSSFLHDKIVLELGPGINFGPALIFSCYGSRSIVADYYLSQWDQIYHPAFYTLLRDTLIKEKPDLNPAPLNEIISKGNYLPEVISCYNNPIENLSGISDESIDIIFSNAVLEHLYDFKKAFKQMARITKPRGLGFHQVDFRDHRDFAKPLEHLLLNKKEFSKMFKARLGECGSQYRYVEIQHFMEKAGFVIEKFTPNMFAEEKYLDEFIKRLREAKKSQYKSRSRDDIKVLGGLFHLYKP